MGRVCNGPRMLWAEFVMGRNVPEPSGDIPLRTGSTYGSKITP